MDRLVDILKACADPTRAKIICLCRRAELSVSELTRVLGQSQPRVSRHLKILVEAGLLDRYREGQFALFRLSARGQAGEVAEQIALWADESEDNLAPELAALREVIAERATAAGDYFASNAARWDEIRQLHIGDEQVEQAILERLGGEPIDTLVDLGTGTGRMIELAGPIANRVVGVDLSRDMLAMARGNLSKAQSAGTLGVDWQVRQGDLHRLPLEGRSADAAIMHQVLHFVEDPKAALAEVNRILRPGGRLILVDFARHDIDSLRTDHAHTWLGFSESELSMWLAQAGFSSIEVDQLPGSPLTILIWHAVADAQGTRRPLNQSIDDSFAAEAI